MHRLIREDEVVAVLAKFSRAHWGHLADIEATIGPWSIALHCPECDDCQTYEVDNEERREARALKGMRADVALWPHLSVKR